MNKERLFLILSIIGIFILFTILNFTEYKEISNPNNLTTDPPFVAISGNISKITINEEVTYLKLKETSIQFVIFSNKNLNLSINQQVKIYGQFEIYKNQSQIIVNKIKKI